MAGTSLIPSIAPPLPAALVASVTLGLPLLAWGLLGAGVPLLIHLVFRERAQREVFPAMRFLVQSHLSATRAQWLRHLLLMLARMAVIVLAVAMLGRLGCTREGNARGLAALSAASPASVVLCIDNSASMGYRYQGQTRVQLAVDWARAVLDDGRLFGPGSQFAVISGTPSAGMGVWREDRRAASRLLDTIRPAGHNLSASHLLGNAYSLLAAARHPRREIYLFNDLTETSWSDTLAPAPPSLTSLQVMDVGQDENRNVALSWPQIPGHAFATDAPVRIPLRVQAGELPSEPVLQFSVDGKPRGRQAAGSLAAGSQTEIVLNLPALERGAHALEVTLEPGDALAADNTRYAWLIAGDLPRVGLLSDSAENEVARMVHAMIAPPGLARSEQRYAVEPIALDHLLTKNTDGMMAIVVADVQRFNGLAWDKLATYVKSGGTLLVVPGPSLSPDGYRGGEAILPAAIESISACAPPLRPAASNLTHQYLAPFADLSIDSINDRHAFKRLSLGAVPKDSTVVFPFNDGAPALAESRSGKGRSILLAFSPAADWGQFGTQAAPMLVLLHRILESIRPPLENWASTTAGRPAIRAVGEGTAPLLVRSQDGREATVIPSASRRYPLPADSPQLYWGVEKSNPKQAALYYSVNVAESESRSLRIDGDILKSRFDNTLVRLVRPGDELSASGEAGSRRVNWGVPLGMVLVALLLIESSFANRFYQSFRPNSFRGTSS